MARKPRKPLKEPRTDAYSRLLSRFYEPLILLEVLGKTRGSHISILEDPTTLQYKRRRLLRNLSYLCDYDKGGHTTCSIGLEERPEHFNFWVAYSKSCPKNDVIKFLQFTLAGVKRLIILEGEEKTRGEDAFIRKCIEFAKPRARKETRMLQTHAKVCKRSLDGQKMAADAELTTWLDRLTSVEDMCPVDMCYLAYQERKAPQIKRLSSILNACNEGSNFGNAKVAFESFRHRLGRLAHHVRGPKEVIEDSRELHRLFDEYHVHPVESEPGNPRPPADSLTTLPSMLGRMLQAQDRRLQEYQESLMTLDQKFAILKRVLRHYNGPQPCVHVEIRVLEHFSKRNLTFADSDNYIGCSKPACYCCRLYFRYHPSEPVEPESHQNVWVNWGIPALPGGANDPDYKAQRDMLNKMVDSIRKDALNQITQQSKPFKWHADSETGITESIILPGLGPDIIEPISPEPRATVEYFDTVSQAANSSIDQPRDALFDSDSSSNNFKH